MQAQFGPEIGLPRAVELIAANTNSDHSSQADEPFAERIKVNAAVDCRFDGFLRTLGSVLDRHP